MDEPPPELPEQPEGERWDPLGAPNDEEDTAYREHDHDSTDCNHCSHSLEKLKSLEQEQELLNSSLLALTTHFAQVQFRLRQIVNAPLDDKEEMLRALEEFAFRGVPDVQQQQTSPDECTLIKAVCVKRCQQRELIDQLKYQLHELESYAFETGEAGVPQDVLLERQRVIFDELKTKMNLDVDELQPRQMTPTETAVGSIVSPLKMKEHLVNQLKTQVADLERFIQFLQTATSGGGQCDCCGRSPPAKGGGGGDLRDSIHMVKRAANLLQMFAMVQFGCGGGMRHAGKDAGGGAAGFRKNDLKNTAKVQHWGDMRAMLQLAVAHILETSSDAPPPPLTASDGYSSDAEDAPTTVACDVRVTRAVRKHLATSLRDLMQHGLTAGQGHAATLVPFIGCFGARPGIGRHAPHDMHAWQLVMMYYTLKNGEQYNATPARKLSQSFNLDIVAGTAISNKQSMLSTIGSIVSTHQQYKRSHDSHFKAFVCAALNSNKLVAWLRLLYQCRQLVQMHYLPWSYALQTGFQDTLQCLDTLTTINFDLPVDLAVRQFQSIKDVFT